MSEFTRWFAGIPGGANSMTIGESSDWTASKSMYSWFLCIETMIRRLKLALPATCFRPSLEM